MFVTRSCNRSGNPDNPGRLRIEVTADPVRLNQGIFLKV
jgi:hypothetical protein